MRIRTAIDLAAGICIGIWSVVLAEVRAGRAGCLVMHHQWWTCEACVRNGQPHRICSRCGAEG